MADLEIYEIDSAYIEYLSAFEEHLFRNKKVTQDFSRKYIGIILEIEGFKYFAPLSSFKPKHKRLCETDDFIKIGVYAVINLNNMFPAPLNICKPVLISDIKNEHYKNSRIHSCRQSCNNQGIYKEDCRKLPTRLLQGT